MLIQVIVDAVVNARFPGLDHDPNLPKETPGLLDKLRHIK